ncbi:MAG: SRPBCC family protein [Actinobacteria bacterium]|nr:SRPBCC family protein [Actinomycetota bacterium]
MIRFEGHLEDSRPPALVFDLLADMASLSEWNPNVTRSRRVSGDRFEIGSTPVGEPSVRP